MNGARLPAWSGRRWTRFAQVATEQADGLFKIIDVVGADGVFAVGVLK